MDTIPSTHRLIPFPTSSQAARHHSHTTQATNAWEDLQQALRRYNIAVKRLTLTGRASTMAQLCEAHLAVKRDGIATLVLHDSPTWAAVQSPALPVAGNTAKVLGRGIARPINPSSRAELRAYARRKGVGVHELWARFPPATDAEHQEMLRDTQPKKRVAADPFEAAVRAAARKEKRELTDAFRQEFKDRVSSLANLLGDLL